MTTTPEQRRERNELLAQALEQNPRKTTGRMRDDEGGRCCLCVARDVALANGLELPEKEPFLKPERTVADWYGWVVDRYDRIPEITNPDEPRQTQLATHLNDALDLPHTEIARWFRHTYCNDTP